MNIALVQSNTRWQDWLNNHDYLEGFLKQAANSELIVLPEMFNSGFTMNAAEVAQSMEGPTVDWMKHWSNELQAAICGSIVIVENGQYFNRMLFVYPNGDVRHYDKRHLFTMGREQEHYKPGTERVVVEWQGWRILLQVCYDLRFPVFARNSNDRGYDLALFVASWPAVRISAWDVLLQARAVENQCYTVGVNRVGTDGNEVAHCGHSTVVDPYGEKLLTVRQAEGVYCITLDKASLEDFRRKFPLLQDADNFTLTISR